MTHCCQGYMLKFICINKIASEIIISRVLIAAFSTRRNNMDYLKEFNRIMDSTTNMAIATAVDNIPNVRIVNFCYDPKREGVVYFSTQRVAPKTTEFAQNNKVAFTTIPREGAEQVRVYNATIQKSDLTIHDLKDAFIQKYPEYKIVIEKVGDRLDIYEIHFKEANVTLSIDAQGKVVF